jgi:aminopeptidase N
VPSTLRRTALAATAFLASACVGSAAAPTPVFPVRAAPPAVEPPPIEMGLPPAPGRYDGRMDVVHYDLEIVLPPENDRILGEARIRYLSSVAGPHPVILDLTGLAVESVTWEGAPIPFRHESGEIHVRVPGRPSTTDTLELGVRYRGTPDDGLILRSTIHGDPSAFADNWPNRARFWFPSNDHPSDRATVTFTVHAPAGRPVIANGTLLQAAAPADPGRTGGIENLLTWVWASRVPIPTYLMVIGSAPMQILHGGLAACGMAPASPRADGCVEISNWVFAPDTAHARRVFARSGAMLDFYARLVGPYPFEKLANVQASTRFGGMENASAIFYSERSLAEGRDIEGTVAHEIAHQWFGDHVTPADWPHLWLSEGFASYFGPLFFEHAEGIDDFRGRLAEARERYLASDVTGRPVVDHSAANLMELLNRNSYQKGALILHMLRWVMGDEDFFEGIRRYHARHGGSAVETDQFRAVAEEVHGEPLDWFFTQWLMEPGYPRYRVDWRWDAAAGEAEVVVRQEQDGTWPAFRMPVELEFTLPAGTVRVTEWVEGREWRGRIPLPAAPGQLRLDPDGWILKEMVTDR